MSTSYHKLRQKAEDAIERVILSHTSDLSDCAFFKRHNNQTLSTPRIAIACTRVEPEIIGGEGGFAGELTGNGFAYVSVFVTSHRSELDRETHNERCALVEDALMRNDVVALINRDTADQLHAYSWRPEYVGDDDGNEIEVTTPYGGILYCCPTEEPA